MFNEQCPFGRRIVVDLAQWAGFFCNAEAYWRNCRLNQSDVTGMVTPQDALRPCLYSLEKIMKKLSIIAAAAAAAIAASTAAPVVAQEQQSNDPFVATQLSAIPALLIFGGAAVIVAITAGSGTN
jgi:hypothetical protein